MVHNAIQLSEILTASVMVDQNGDLVSVRLNEAALITDEYYIPPAEMIIDKNEFQELMSGIKLTQKEGKKVK